jgi:hypothetical protein
MPKLNAQIASKVEAQETQNYEALPADTYTVRLLSVDPKESANGNPAWSWTYEVVEGDHKGRRLWDYTSLVDAALWRVKAVFDAFGTPPDTDTDELLGKQVRLVVSQRVIPTGKRQGEIGNQIDRVLPAKTGAPAAASPTAAAVPAAASAEAAPSLF